MPVALGTLATLAFGCMPSAQEPARRAAQAAPVRATPVPRFPDPFSERATVPSEYDERCVRPFTDDHGAQRYDFSCAWQNEPDVRAQHVSEESCTRRFVDRFGVVRYEDTCARPSARIELETAARKEACAARGGDWGKHGWFEFEGCAWHAKDAGKACRDRSECESRVCLAPSSASRDRAATGGCAECVGDCALAGLVVEQGIARARTHEN